MRAVLSLSKCRLFFLCVFILSFSSEAAAPASSDFDHSKRQSTAAAPLVDFQVSEPVLTPTGSSNENGCVFSQVLMTHVFDNSYGNPFMGQYRAVCNTQQIGCGL